MKSCAWNASSVAILVQDDIFVFCSPFQAEKSFADLAVAIESGEATVLAEPVGTEIVLSWWKGRERWQLARGAEMRRHLLRSDRGERYGADVHVTSPGMVGRNLGESLLTSAFELMSCMSRSKILRTWALCASLGFCLRLPPFPAAACPAEWTRGPICMPRVFFETAALPHQSGACVGLLWHLE